METVLFQTIMFNISTQFSPIRPLDRTLSDATTPSQSEAFVMLELWGMWITPLLLSLPGSLWPGMVAPDNALSMGQILINCVLTLKGTV